MDRKIIIFSILFFGAMSLVWAQQPMTLTACREQALTHNRELQSASYKKQEAEANLKAAKTAYLPSVEASANLMYLPNMSNMELPGGFLPTAASAEAGSAGNFSGLSDVYSPGMSLNLENLFVMYGGIQVSMPLYAGGKIRYSNKMAEAAVSVYANAYELKADEVILKTDQAYWNMVSIASNLKLVEKYVEMLSELEEQMNDMYEVGLKPASEKLRVTVKRNEAELNLLKARNGLKLSKMYLNQIIGQPLETDISIADSLQGDIDMPNILGGADAALSLRSELKILQQKVAISEYDQKLAMADHLPMAGIAFSYQGAYVDNLLESPEFSPSIAGQLKIPLFKWGQGKHKQRAAQFKVKQAQTDLKNTNEQISLQVAKVGLQLEEVYEEVQIAQKNLVEAEESLSETIASFEVGLNTTTELLNAQADWQKANAQLITSLANFEVMKTTWSKAIGIL